LLLVFCIISNRSTFNENLQEKSALNEKKIQEVIEIEKQADAIFNQAVSEADRIPHQAEIEAKALIEKARSDAEKEAKEILANAEAKDECEKILAQAQENIQHGQTTAKQNFDRSVTFVISRVLGRDL
jgi:vacuolar-type H+-ATPase subunit H